MLLLRGQILNTAVTPRRETKDGQAYGGDDKIQVVVDEPGDDGTVIKKMIDLKVDDRSIYKNHQGKTVTVPVGAFSPAKNQVVFFVSGKPEFA